MACRPAIVHCCRLVEGHEFEAKAAESLKDETLRYPLRATIGARSNKLQLAGCEMASGDRHSKGSIPYGGPKRPDLSGRQPARSPDRKLTRAP